MIDMEKFPVLKSLNRFIITFFFVMGVTFNTVAPFSIVNADSVFLVSENGNPVNTGFAVNGSFRMMFSSGNIDILYCVPVFSDSNYSNATFLFFSDNDGTMKYRGFGSGWKESSAYSQNLDYSSQNNKYYFRLNTNTTYSNVDNVSQYLIIENVTSLSNDELLAQVLESENTDIYILGTIEDVKYSTQINSHGDDSVDTISWYPYFDSNNNPAVGWNAQIRVVPGYYYDSDRDSLMQQAFNLFHKEEDQAELIYNDHFVQGSFSITWGDVRNKISITSWQDLFGSFVSILDGSYWYKRGWIYQIRIYDRDNDLYSEWQDVYTVTSSSGEGVENIIDPASGGGSADFYNNVENSFNTTSVVNNNYDVTYYYVNTPVDTNPSSDDSNEYLKEIRNNVIQIRQMISIDNNANNTPNNDTNPWIGNPAAELYDFEDSSINDFNDAVGDLPTSDLITGNKFLAASTWVRTQYETLVSNTPFEAVIIFSLLLGFGLLLIGKLR